MGKLQAVEVDWDYGYAEESKVVGFPSSGLW